MNHLQKNHSQWARLGFAFQGLKSAWKGEASFRTEVYVGAAILLGLGWLHITWIGWIAAIFSLAFALFAELMNTAVEHVCDALHPGQHPLIKIAKDCASAAVLAANLNGFVVVGLILLWGRQ